MASKIRVAEAGKIVARRVDEGYMIDQEILNLNVKRDAIVMDILDITKQHRQDSEKSIRFAGTELAIVTVTEQPKVKFNIAEETPEDRRKKAAFEDNVDKGVYEGVVTPTIKINAPSKDIFKLVEKLQSQLGLDVSLGYAISAPKLEKFKEDGSKETIKVLTDVIEESSSDKCTFRAKDEKTAKVTTRAAAKAAKKVTKKKVAKKK